MAQLLRIDASPRDARSHTRRLADVFIEAWLARHPADRVVRRDVGFHPPPPVDESWIEAAFTGPQERTPAMRAALALSDELVDELLASDVLLLGIPMYNFGIPAALKAWIDQVVRVGRTFAFEPDDPHQPYRPLTRGKRAFAIVATGDDGYEPGGPMGRMNQVEPYLRTVLPFIGIMDIDFVYVGNDEFGGDRLERAVNAAVARVRELAARAHRPRGPVEAEVEEAGT
ncbi:MAG: NAD(P)H-dependent oxidoreductase [Pseudomonadota bacterium]|jgi:FMN-dependent NADH-azoreductase|nr:MAG: FMN-dependent NADH-azoreductase [Pseudomonadota bacterium]